MIKLAEYIINDSIKDINLGKKSRNKLNKNIIKSNG